MADEIGVGLVGYGMAARVFHAPVIESVAGLRLLKVVERRGEESRRRHPHVEVVRDADELLADERVELVVVATPNHTHFELARQSLLAGRHVVVEKPFTNTSAEARQLIELARAGGRLITVHHNRRWDGDFLTVRKIIGGGLLGRLAEYESHYDRFRNHPRPGAWREEPGAGGGILYDLGAHLIDQALALFGPPRAVTAALRVQREFAHAVDSFDLRLDYDRLKVSLGAGMLVREPRARFRLHGSSGSFVKRGMDPQEEALKRGEAPGAQGWGEEPPERWGTLDAEVGGVRVRGRVETVAGSYASFYQNVADAVRGRAELAVKPEESLNVIRVIELALRSDAEGRTVPFAV